MNKYHLCPNLNMSMHVEDFLFSSGLAEGDGYKAAVSQEWLMKNHISCVKENRTYWLILQIFHYF